MTDTTLKTGRADAPAEYQELCQPEPKWGARVEDQYVPTPGHTVTVAVLKEQAKIPPGNVLVRDLDGECDEALKDDQTVDLRQGNVFYVVPECEAPADNASDKKPKLAFFVDDRPEETFRADQTGKTLRDLFSFTLEVKLFRDYDSPRTVRLVWRIAQTSPTDRYFIPGESTHA